MLEVLTALAILALASSSVLVVIDRCVSATADSALRLEAFKLAREKMEEVLVRDSVEESVDSGTSDAYPDLTWQTVVEAFPEPVNGEMWVRAVCSAEYIDSKDETQKVELVHWIAALSDQQTDAIMTDEQLAQLEADQSLPTAEDAARYAHINADTLQQWMENGLKTTDDGGFIKFNLDLFVKSQGEPSEQDKAKQVGSIQELAMTLRTLQKEMESGADGSGTGLSPEEIEKMDLSEMMKVLQEKQP